MMFRWAVVGLFVALFSAVHGQSQAADPLCNSASCVNLVVDGDSISVGWGAEPPHRLDVGVAGALGGNVRLHNVALGGRPVSECLTLYPKLVAPLFDPSTPHNVILFHAGDNDIVQGHNALQTYAAFTSYVAAAHKQGWKVVVSTEIQRLDWGTYMLEQLKDYNFKLRQNKAGADAVVDVDSDHRMTDPAARHNPALFTADEIHPSDGGYAVLIGLAAPVVKRIAGR